MNKIEFVLIAILINALTVNSKVFYLFCGFLFTPYASERLDELRQIIYIYYINHVRIPKLRKIVDSLKIFDYQQKGAKKISFVGEFWKNVAFQVIVLLSIYSIYEIIDNEESESDVIGSTADANDRSDDPQPFLPITEHIPYDGAVIKLPNGAAQFYAMMNNRRSVRAFSTRPVDYAIIEMCIQAAGTAPSGAHTEPWTFCIVEDSSIKLAIRDIIENEEYANYTHRMSRQWTADLTPLQTNHEKPYLTDAPYLILVFKQIYGMSHSMTPLFVILYIHDYIRQ